jgi:hypothetical protein
MRIPADWLIRLRHNPFYDYLERTAIEWIERAEEIRIGDTSGASKTADDSR